MMADFAFSPMTGKVSAGDVDQIVNSAPKGSDSRINLPNVAKPSDSGIYNYTKKVGTDGR